MVCKSRETPTGARLFPQTVAPPGTWVLDPAHSTVGFAIRHLMVATVPGSFEGSRGRCASTATAMRSRSALLMRPKLETGNSVRDGRLHAELLSTGISDTVNVTVHITLAPGPTDWPCVR